MIKADKFRIYPNKTATKKLRWVLDRCRELYNAALIERRDAYEMHVKQHPSYYDEQTRKQRTHELNINYYTQQNDLPTIKHDLRPEYQEIASHMLQNVLMRLQRAFDNFFRRVQQGEEPGYPRIQGRNRYDSFTYPDKTGWKLEGIRHLKLTKIGTVKVKFHREIVGSIKTLTIKREGEHWYAAFTCEVQAEPLPTAHEDVGIDLGVTHFAALSNGEFIDHPRYLRKGAKKLERAQQSLDRKKRGSHRRQKAGKQVAKQHRKIARQRRDFHHKVSRKLVNRYQVIVLEDLRIANLTRRPKPKQDENGKYLPNGASAKAGLNKSILDAGWYTFTEMVSAKAASAGRTMIFVNPFMTSQLCSGCGAVVRKDLSERWHSCGCGTELDRDTNSAKLILNLGYKELPGGRRPTSARV